MTEWNSNAIWALAEALNQAPIKSSIWDREQALAQSESVNNCIKGKKFILRYS